MKLLSSQPSQVSMVVRQKVALYEAIYRPVFLAMVAAGRFQLLSTTTVVVTKGQYQMSPPKNCTGDPTLRLWWFVSLSLSLPLSTHTHTTARNPHPLDVLSTPAHRRWAQRSLAALPFGGTSYPSSTPNIREDVAWDPPNLLKTQYVDSHESILVCI